MWQFSSPEIVYGEDALSRLADIRSRRVVVITDQALVELGYSRLVEEQLGAETALELFADVEPEPAIQTARRARQVIDDVQPDHIIAVGGGSVLDVAKVAWFLHEHPEVLLEEISIFATYSAPKTRLIAIPTTAGSGAEVTVGVVLSDPESRRKLAIYAYELQPTLIIVDPRLTEQMPSRLVADTGIDAVSHAIESFTGAWHNDFSDGLSVHALRLAFRYLPLAYANGASGSAREHMQYAATIAGLAITNSSIALGHALAHSLGALLSIPHGRAVGVMLPYSMAYTANGGGGRYAELACLLGYEAENESEGLTVLLDLLRDLFGALGQPMSIRDLGLSRSEFEQILPDLVSGAAGDHQLLTTIRVPDEDELMRLCRYAYDGWDVDF
jgi:alcohol dehydrogenase class IV